MIIPAAMQRIENPFPYIAYPDWVSIMIARKTNQQKSLNNYFSKNIGNIGNNNRIISVNKDIEDFGRNNDNFEDNKEEEDWEYENDDIDSSGKKRKTTKKRKLIII